jgi:hypothetical protein
MQIGQLKRREFIALLGSTVGWPVATRAQQAANPLCCTLTRGIDPLKLQCASAFRLFSHNQDPKRTRLSTFLDDMP